MVRRRSPDLSAGAALPAAGPKKARSAFVADPAALVGSFQLPGLLQRGGGERGGAAVQLRVGVDLLRLDVPPGQQAVHLEQGTGSNAYAYATLTAGRPGSWESELLPTLVRFGNDLNLADAPAGDLAQRRARGPHTRVDATVRDELAAVLERWVTAPEQYIEVAENLASLVSRTADEQYGADGWGRIADQWLDPTAPVHNTEAEPLYRLLYSRSAYSS